MEAITAAVVKGDVRTVERECYSQAEDFMDTIASTAARFGQLNVLEWCVAQPHYDLTTALPVIAAAHGQMQILVWLQCRLDSMQWNPWVCTLAASRGDLNMLQWLRKVGCVWSTDTCAAAAGQGGLHVLKWLRSGPDPCPWSVSKHTIFVDKRTMMWSYLNVPLDVDARQRASQVISEMTQAYLALERVLPDQVPSPLIKDMIESVFLD